MNMNVLLYYSNLSTDSGLDELDVLEEAAFFKTHLEELDYKVHSYAFPNNFNELEKHKLLFNPEFIVNLVETINNDGRLIHIAPSFFDYLKIPYTGCSSESIYLSSNKLLTKIFLSANNVNMPQYLDRKNIEKNFNANYEYLIKSVWEHASVGLDESTLRLYSDKKDIFEILNNAHKIGKEVFAEQYIDGREFNIAMLGSDNGPQVLSPAEIIFQNYPDEKLKVVGYRAKWIKDTFEYKNTIRTFDFKTEDSGLLNELKKICLKCWDIFNLKGYARVDFRIAQNGYPYVLEVNTNPCFSSDGGFIAAVKKTNISYKELFQRIINEAYK